MKKLLIVLMLLLMLLVGCGKINYSLEGNKFCVIKQKSVKLSDDEKKYIIDLLNNSDWADGVLDMQGDVLFYTKDQLVNYDSSTGYFEDQTNKRYTRVKEEERLYLYDLLYRYIFFKKSDNTELEFWINQDLKESDIAGHYYYYYEIEGLEKSLYVYGDGYYPTIDDDGTYIDPDYCVKYRLVCLPDIEYKYVKDIYITDPTIHILGLTIESSISEFDEVLSQYGFVRAEGRDTLDPRYEYKELWDLTEINRYSITLIKYKDGKYSMDIKCYKWQ